MPSFNHAVAGLQNLQRDILQSNTDWVDNQEAKGRSGSHNTSFLIQVLGPDNLHVENGDVADAQSLFVVPDSSGGRYIKVNLHDVDTCNFFSPGTCEIRVLISNERGFCVTGAGGGQTTAILTDILAELRDDTQFDWEWVTDCDTGVYYRRKEIGSQDDGSVTVEYYDGSGVLTAAPTNVCPILPSEVKTMDFCLAMMTDTPFHEEGDIITRVVCYDMSGATPAVMGTLHYNQTKGFDATMNPPLPGEWQFCDENLQQFAPMILCDDNGQFIRHWIFEQDGQIIYRDQTIAGIDYFPTGKISQCNSGGGGGIEITSRDLYEYDPVTKEVKEIHAVMGFLEDGTYVATGYYEADAMTPYTPTGDLFHKAQRYNLGGQTIPFTGGAVVTLTPPVGATLAEITVVGGDVVYENDAAMPAPTATYTTGYRAISAYNTFELEGVDEINGLRAIGFIGGTNGATGRLEVRYKTDLRVND